MATITGLTKDRMLAIEAESITAARIDLVTHHLILTTHGGTDIDVGDVSGPPGPDGPAGGATPGSTVVGPSAPGEPPSAGVDNTHFSKADHDHGYPSIPGQLLGVHQYAPAALDFKNTSSVSLVTIDNVNAVTPVFTAPTSGRVLVKINGTFFTNDGTEMMFALFEHGTTTQVGFTNGTVAPSTPSSINFPPIVFLVSGLTPGDPYQFDLAWATTGSGGEWNARGAQGVVGAATSPFLAEVWSA